VRRHEIAIGLLSLPDGIRGFGPVKAEAMDRAAGERQALLRELLQPEQAETRRAAA